MSGIKVHGREFGNAPLMRLFRTPAPSATALLIAATLAAPPAGAGGIEKGRALAERLCASCHLGPGQGEKTGASSIPGFYAVARRPNQTVAGIIDWLRSVPPMMPNHRLTQDEMAALAAYIMSLKDESR